jgi:hypothetical protein
VVLSVDSENTSINTIAGELLYPKDIVKVEEILDGNSILNLWIEKPQVDKAGKIVFSGTVPGGFVQAKAKLYTIVFKVVGNGNGQIALDNMQVLKNDGEGVSVPVQAKPLFIQIADEHANKKSSWEEVTDTDKPEDFKPEIVKTKDIAGDRYVLVFITQDKLSGIDRYEIKEGDYDWFTEETSPYVLKDQSLSSDIFVKAIDKRGNERIVLIQAKNTSKNYEYKYILGILILVSLITYICVKKFFKKRIKN